MATKAQLAARKLFAERAKAGTLRKPSRKKNPAKKAAAKKTMRKSIPRKSVSKSAYVERPSQITRKTPTKRLKARRKVAPRKKVFPNPTRAALPFSIKQGGKIVARFPTKALALEYANALARKTKRAVEVHD